MTRHATQISTARRKSMETKRDSSPTTSQEPWRGDSEAHPSAQQPAGEWAANQLRDLAKTAREGLEEAAGYVEDAAAMTEQKVAEYREGGVERIKNDVITYTREQPVTALLLAAAAGVVLGVLSALGRK